MSDEKNNPTQLTDPEKQIYLELLKLHNTNRIDYNTRKWETIKFFQGFHTALIAATVIATFTAAEKGVLKNPIVRGFLALMALYAGMTAWTGFVNLRRESRLLFMEEGTMFKLARLIELDRVVSENSRWLAGDAHLLMEKWRDPKYKAKNLPQNSNFDQWLDERTRGHYFAELFSRLFVVGIIVAVLLALVILFSHQWGMKKEIFSAPNEHLLGIVFCLTRH